MSGLSAMHIFLSCHRNSGVASKVLAKTFISYHNHNRLINAPYKTKSYAQAIAHIAILMDVCERTEWNKNSFQIFEMDSRSTEKDAGMYRWKKIHTGVAPTDSMVIQYIFGSYFMIYTLCSPSWRAVLCTNSARNKSIWDNFVWLLSRHQIAHTYWIHSGMHCRWDRKSHKHWRRRASREIFISTSTLCLLCAPT